MAVRRHAKYVLWHGIRVKVVGRKKYVKYGKKWMRIRRSKKSYGVKLGRKFVRLANLGLGMKKRRKVHRKTTHRKKGRRMHADTVAFGTMEAKKKKGSVHYRKIGGRRVKCVGRKKYIKRGKVWKKIRKIGGRYRVKSGAHWVPLSGKKTKVSKRKGSRKGKGKRKATRGKKKRSYH